MLTIKDTLDTLAPWTQEYADRATSEGWCISNRSSGQLEIQRLDAADVFPEDTLAVFFVYDRALCGDEHARVAMSIVLDPRNIYDSAKQG